MFYLNGYLSNWINSDDSSELILSKLLSENNAILTSDWFYSTELRVLNTQLFYTFFFKLINNWHAVRLLSIFCMLIVMLVSCYFLFKQFDISKFFWGAAVILVIPFSYDYFHIVLKGAYYIPHITISFLTVGLLELQNRLLGKGKFFTILLLVFVAFMAGLGGPRQIIIIYLPALLASIGFMVKKVYQYERSNDEIESNLKRCIFSVPWLFSSSLSLIVAVLGCYINTKIQYKVFDFGFYGFSFSEYKFKEFKFMDLEKLIDGFMGSTGYSSGTIFSFQLFYNAISILWNIFTIVAIFYAFRNSSKISEKYFRIAVLTLCCYMVFIALYLFTELGYVDRYNLPIIVFSIPSIILFFKESLHNYQIQRIVVFLVVSVFAIRGVCYYQDLKDIKNDELIEISSFLNEQDYKHGYATFWNANVVTELTNGEIEVWDWGDFNNDFDCIDQIYHWLQLKNHKYIHPTGKVFWILSNQQNDNFHFTRNLSKGHIIKRTPKFVVYGFSSYAEMYSLVGVHNFENLDLKLKFGQSFETKNVKLYPDRYMITVQGTNLSNTEIAVTSSASEFYRTVKNDHAVLVFDASDIIENFRILFKNLDEHEAVVKKIQIVKDDVYYADFYSSNWIKEGHDSDGTRILNKGGVSYGPYITLIPGTYRVECEGIGLEHISYYATYKIDNRVVNFDITNVELSDNRLEYEFSVSSTQDDCEVRFFNNSDDLVQIRNLRLQRKY